MMKYISIFLIAAVITSCGGKQKTDEKDSKPFSFSYDLDGTVNNVNFMNLHTLETEGNNTFSSIDSTDVHSFGIQFSSDLVKDLFDVPYTVSAKIRKEEINSNASLIFSCTNNGEVTAWQTVKVDSNYISDTNQWTDFSYTGFTLPTTTPENSDIRIYFWSVDGKRMDIDDFKLDIIQTPLEELH